MLRTVKGGAPVAVGGIGGSGTRLVAECLMQLGFFLGTDLNRANDNLWFTLIFKRAEILDCRDTEFQTCVELFAARMQGSADLRAADRAWLDRLAQVDRPQHDSRWLKERVATFCSPSQAPDVGIRWGWKEPNTHLIVDRLLQSIPALKYIHVVRNGLDMAYGHNQNQLRLWGPRILGLTTVEIDPRHALTYWCRAHERLIGIADRFPGRCLLLNFDELCADPHQGLLRVLRFIDAPPGLERLDELVALVKPPSSIGRFRRFGTAQFEVEDVRRVAALGFPIE